MNLEEVVLYVSLVLMGGIAGALVTYGFLVDPAVYCP